MLTYVIFVVDDRVEGHVFPVQVSLGRLHVVVAVVALDEAFKLTVHDGAVAQGSFLPWKPTRQWNGCSGKGRKDQAGAATSAQMLP